jgi:hypothetical protein
MFQVSGNFFPGIEAVTGRRLGWAIPQVGHIVGHREVRGWAKPACSEF